MALVRPHSKSAPAVRAAIREEELCAAGPIPSGFTLDTFIALVRNQLYKKMQDKQWGHPIANVILLSQCLRQFGWECEAIGMRRRIAGGGATASIFAGDRFALLIGGTLVIDPRGLRGWDAILKQAEKVYTERQPPFQWEIIPPADMSKKAADCFGINTPGTLVEEVVREATTLIHERLLQANTPCVETTRPAPRL